MFIEGISIENEKLAQKFYDLMDENEQAVIAFGMFPADKMEALRKAIEVKIENDAKDQCEEQFGFRPETNVALKDLNVRFVVKAMHQITVDMFQCAKNANKLVV